MDGVGALWGVEVCFGDDVLEGSEGGLLVWGEMGEMARGNVWIDLFALERLGLCVG